MKNELMRYLQELLDEAVERAENDMTRAIMQDDSDVAAMKFFNQFSIATKMKRDFEDFAEKERQE